MTHAHGTHSPVSEWGSFYVSRLAENAITVVIPTFNRRALLQKAVESALQETRVPLRVHIFDNASTDDTQSYVTDAAASDPRVTYFKNEENVGPQGNYARAMASINTEYFVPLADDDWLLPNFVFDAYQIMQAHDDIGAGVFVTEVRDGRGNLFGTYPSGLDKICLGRIEPRQHFEEWVKYGHHGWSSILWRSSVLKIIGPPYLHVGLPSDVDFQAQIFCRVPVYIVNQTGAVFLSHNRQESLGNNISTLASWAALFERLDAAVRASDVVPAEKYLELRKILQNRHKPAWGNMKAAEFDDKQLVALATTAGFRLGDWDLAFALLDRLSRAELERHEVASSGKAALLPEFNDVYGRVHDPLSFMLWLKNHRPPENMFEDQLKESLAALTRLKGNFLVRVLYKLGLIRL